MGKVSLPLAMTQQTSHPSFLLHISQAEPESLKVYQIELTGRCNAACDYCPHSERDSLGHMSWETYRQALFAAKNRVIGLHHFGEPLLHPDVFDMVEFAASRGYEVGFSTNGELLTQEKLDHLAQAGLRWLRLHTDPFGVRLERFVVPDGLEMTEHAVETDNGAKRKEKVTFSGYTEAPSTGKRPCSFIEQEWCVVLHTGAIGLCCHDINATQNLGLCIGCDGYQFDSPRDFGDYDGASGT